MIFLAVYGLWGEWTPTGKCTKCGVANRTRFRHCDSPASANIAFKCSVDGSEDNEIQVCDPDPCPCK